MQIPRLRRGSPSHLWASIVLAVYCSGPAIAATPFWSEGFEAYALGDVNLQGNWWAPLRSWPVSTINPSEGNQHLRGQADGEGLSLVYALNISDPQEEAFLSILAEVSITPGAAWTIVAQSSSANRSITSVRFEPNGTISAVTDQGYTNTGATYPLNEYFSLALTVRRADKFYDLRLNGDPVFSAQGFHDSIDQLVILNYEPVVGPTIDVDAIRMYDSAAPIIPEPGTLHLCLAPVMAWLFKRRTKRQ